MKRLFVILFSLVMISCACKDQNEYPALMLENNDVQGYIPQNAVVTIDVLLQDGDTIEANVVYSQLFSLRSDSLILRKNDFCNYYIVDSN